MLVGIETDEPDLLAEMAALGLPTTFIASSKGHSFKEKKKPKFSSRSCRKNVSQSLCYSPTTGEQTNVIEQVSLCNDTEAIEGSWESLWSDEYQQFYFFNTSTMETAWLPPKGLEWNATQETFEKTNTAILRASEGISSSTLLLQAKETHQFAGLSNPPRTCVSHIRFDSDESSQGEHPRFSKLPRTCGSHIRFDSDESSQEGEYPGHSLDWTEGDVQVKSKPVPMYEEVQDNAEDGCQLELPRTCGSHIRFDSDESSQEGECSGYSLDWTEGDVKVEPKPVPVYEKVQDNAEDSYELEPWVLPCSYGNMLWTKVGFKTKKLKALDDCPTTGQVLLEGMKEPMNASILKYWFQRYALFTLYDNGIRMDEESWYSVTPEPLAIHHASRCCSGVIIDAFTGVGGNAIQFASMSQHVIAIDVDPVKIELACHNAKIYGVADKIEFIVGDFFQMASKLKGDVIFLSPPWGGPDYLNEETYDLETMLQPKDGFTLFTTAQAIAPNVVLYLPRNVDYEQLAQLAELFSPTLSFNVEENYLNGKLKAITAYYGDIARNEKAMS